MKTEPVACLMCGRDDAALVAPGRDYDYATSEHTFTFVRCRSCGHLYLNPRPCVESAGEIYPRDYYTLDDSLHTGGLRLMERIKDAVVTRRLRRFMADVPQGGHVVDLGCGDGTLLLAVRRARPDVKLTGVDIAISARQRERMAAAGISAVESVLETVTLPDDVSLVVMNQVIEHLWEVDACLKKIHSILRPGGRLSICTPNADSYDARWFHGGAWGGYYYPRHLNLFGRESLTNLCARNGLRMLEWRSLVAPLVWMSTARALQVRRGWPKWGRLKDTNLPFLMLFTAIDLAALALGAVTSNQQIIAVRE